jgi:DNA polymerase sigma
MTDLKRLILRYLEDGMKVQTLSRARVPIVKLKDPSRSTLYKFFREFSHIYLSKLSCDICINNALALQNTKLVSDYSKIDERMKYLSFVVKYWAKKRQINEPYRGTLSSYAYILMIIHFLQQSKPPILPVLQQMHDSDETPNRVEIEGFDCYYYSKVEKLARFGSANTSSLGQILFQFFRWFACEFDWENSVISPRLGTCISKVEKGWNIPVEEDSRDYFFFGLEDPFELTHNLGRPVDKENYKVIRYEFQRAYKLLGQSEDLKTVCQPYLEGEKWDFNI